MNQIKELYRLKDEVINEPKWYLGANISKYQLPNGLEAWSASAWDYVKNSVKNIEEVLVLDSPPSKLQNHIDQPLPISYWPEVDISLLLDSLMMT